MTVAVSCNLPEGVILAVDSAVTLPTLDGRGIAKVYENADKLFQLANRPIGVAVYGLGSLGQRGLGSYLWEFESSDPSEVLSNSKSPLVDVVEALRGFLWNAYQREVIPPLVASLKKPWPQISDEDKPVLGVVVGGFSGDAHLSEVWETVLPRDTAPQSARQIRDQGSFGTNWFAMLGPIRRYIKGWEPELVDELIDYMVQRSTPLSNQEQEEVRQLVDRYAYPIPYAGMPMEEGVAHARFLVELVINHHRYAIGAPVVGGRVRTGKVTYRHAVFELLD